MSISLLGRVVVIAGGDALMARRLDRWLTVQAARVLTVGAELHADTIVGRTLQRLGRLDVVVTNPGATWGSEAPQAAERDRAWHGSLALADEWSLAALPHMGARQTGHVVHCGPPRAFVFEPGYSTYLSTRLALGRLVDRTRHLADGERVAVNILWPSLPMGPRDRLARRRSPQVMCDALAELIRTPPSELTTTEIVDEDILRRRGWSDMRIARYAVGGGSR